MQILRTKTAGLIVALSLSAQIAAVAQAEEACNSPLFQTTGINYDPVSVDLDEVSTAGLTMELLADFQGNGILPGNPTKV